MGLHPLLMENCLIVQLILCPPSVLLFKLQRSVVLYVISDFPIKSHTKCNHVQVEYEGDMLMQGVHMGISFTFSFESI